ncbi:dipeptidase PepE [Tenacibaculum finnmarkense genomovar finnmarkense]|uniref:dipeptidase PepE n=1 Tax=Tenacibaculum finnmarkense TaxID=2781243 RepID=UPI001E447647|nr:dipeptidase PepE [Tenacibaculum finnmarkense]MCD8416912.1 dipeptidase PepE [Tenacibaculum finnmarkense genomovar finnmarkense]MCG8185449.1 dipeptidase PepE [Tenacibaculum finnmarkense genomovar finnmarkense]MCG8201833.1 dipeptidase PepE [Tenacibaculum finnmarkense genomovar finnmarkense]MCG8209418.1 dipeptidase PepE [Tenacibaculum finnmarkense genomovar finnmarkense]MCG8212214.1 dipeptidase PepE [Tenacibaculum finnmarkense genomovar finnmarkense]
MKNMIIASTSTVHASGYLEYITTTLINLFKDTDTILFIPYARPGGITYDQYTDIAKKYFAKLDKKVKGIHEFENQKEALKVAKGIFTGGGNTFELVNQLYKNDIIDTLKNVVENGTAYLGTSAGSNICGVTMMNTNDMPIVYPPSFNTLNLIPFNINAHYLDPTKNSTHMGETRETRIKEYHVFNETPVLGLREGSWLAVTGNEIVLKGTLSARLFQKDKEPIELNTNTKIHRMNLF